MKTNDIKALKQLIDARITVLEALVKTNLSLSEKKHLQESDQSASLDLTVSSTVEEKVIERAKDKINLLKQNLNWLDSEDAGLCENCGCEIPLARFTVVPETRLCVICAEKTK